MAAPGDRLWLTLSKSMEEASEALRVDMGRWDVVAGHIPAMPFAGSSRPLSACSRASRSTHDEAALVEQEADAVDKHLYREGLLAIHEVADQNEEDNEDVQMQR